MESRNNRYRRYTKTTYANAFNFASLLILIFVFGRRRRRTQRVSCLPAKSCSMFSLPCKCYRVRIRMPTHSRYVHVQELQHIQSIVRSMHEGYIFLLFLFLPVLPSILILAMMFIF